MTIFYRFNSVVYTYFAINFTKYVCDEFSWANPRYKPDNYMMIMYDALKEYSDVIRECPYKVLIKLLSQIF